MEIKYLAPDFVLSNIFFIHIQWILIINRYLDVA